MAAAASVPSLQPLAAATYVASEVGALALHEPAVGPFEATMAGRCELQVAVPLALRVEAPQGTQGHSTLNHR